MDENKSGVWIKTKNYFVDWIGVHWILFNYKKTSDGNVEWEFKLHALVYVLIFVIVYFIIK